jgi:hypothetical protein
MYNAHPKLFRHSFWCIDNAHRMYNAHPIPRMFIFYEFRPFVSITRALYTWKYIPMYTAHVHFFLQILTFWCIDNARVIYRKIRYIIYTHNGHSQLWCMTFFICMFSFGYFPGVSLSFADVSEPTFRSIYKGWMKSTLYIQPLKMD